MNGEPYTASMFAASLRRFLHRKHLGLLPHQKCDASDMSWVPVDQGGNVYDWGSPSDILVADPVHADFDILWRSTAKLNTEVFTKAFHAVPNDYIRTWDDYEEFYARHFRLPSGDMPKAHCNEAGADLADEVVGVEELEEDDSRYEYGHIARHKFPEGATEVKQ